VYIPKNKAAQIKISIPRIDELEKVAKLPLKLMRKIPIRAIDANNTIFDCGLDPSTFQAKKGTMMTKDDEIKVASPAVVIFCPIVAASCPNASNQPKRIHVLDDNNENPSCFLNKSKKIDNIITAIPNRIVIV